MHEKACREYCSVVLLMMDQEYFCSCPLSIDNTKYCVTE